jgi:hypothetical protein
MPEGRNDTAGPKDPPKERGIYAGAFKSTPEKPVFSGG